MRILLVTPFVPAPATRNGGGAYLAALAAALSTQAQLGLVSLDEEPRQAPLPGEPWAWVATTRSRDGKGRMGWRRLCTLWHWRRLPLVAAKAWQPQLVPLFERALREFAPDVALVEMAQMAQYLPFLRTVPTILTDHEAGCAANTRTGLGPFGDRRDQRLWQRFVQNYFRQATAVQTVTADDAQTLQGALQRPIEARPPTVPIPAGPLDPAAAPPRALFLGDYRHAPNPEAARRLVEQVLPLVRHRYPAAELWLAGPNESVIADLTSHPGVRVLGFVPDLADLFRQVRLVLAPLWSGHGFRVKVMTALAHGVPVVTNGLGARGCAAPPPAVTTCEDHAALADATLGLLQSPTAARIAGAAAFTWAREHLQADAAAAWQLDRIRALMAAAPA